MLKQLLEEGSGGISSRRALGARLAELKGTKPEDERRSIKRHLGGTLPEEETIQHYAEALGVERSVFPEAERPQSRAAALAEEDQVMHDRLKRMLRQMKRLQQQLEGDDLTAEELVRIRAELGALAASATTLIETIESRQARSSNPARAAAGGSQRGSHPRG